MATEDPQLTIRLNPADNVVIARIDILAGTRIAAESITAKGRVRAGHKVATAPIAVGEPVLRYGQILGFASQPIAPGDHVHVDNLAMADFDRDYAFCEGAHPTEYVPEPATFEGYVRPDGRVGTRNYIAVISNVNCSATVTRHVADAFRFGPALADYPNVDGVVAITHGLGCGMAAQGLGFDILRRVLTGYARHANFGAVVMVGLGCEVMQLGSILGQGGLETGPNLAAMTIQSTGGTRKTIERAIGAIREVLPDVNRQGRQTVSAAELCLALQCGGSDGYSGITANPALGLAVDRLVAHGGGAVLSETPEIYGAEHLLTRRAASPAIGEKLVERIRWWEEYTRRQGGEMNNNPSPGNKAGGITTIVEKSLGAVAKGGSTNLTAVYEYAEPISEKGFVFMDSPGYDPVSATGQVAGGANMLCFTTGRGSAFGCKPVPSIKLATNTPLYNHQTEDMDINCGEIVSGGDSLEDCGRRIFEKILSVASGERTKSEEFGYGENEFVPWQLGATM